MDWASVITAMTSVALRKESVDRNFLLAVGVILGALSLSARRAWIEIGGWKVIGFSTTRSLSARRAWIEILLVYLALIRYLVALRKESVDRNLKLLVILVPIHIVALRKESVDRNSIVLASFRVRITSLSARRAWIEMAVMRQNPGKHYVALRKESVDRNNRIAKPFREQFKCRSPQGERG